MSTGSTRGEKERRSFAVVCLDEVCEIIVLVNNVIVFKESVLWVLKGNRVPWVGTVVLVIRSF